MKIELLNGNEGFTLSPAPSRVVKVANPCGELQLYGRKCTLFT